MKILITGGAGYIGSTIASLLLDSGHTPIILDNLSVGRKEFTAGRIFYQGDVADGEILKKIFAEHPEIEGVVHCAALMAVPESIEKPYEYYRENVAKSLELFKNLRDLGVRKILFSSSASVYGATEDLVVSEATALSPQSPYARTKYIMEMILEDFCRAYDMKGVALRYFNPIGADPKMRTGLHVKNPSAVIGKMLAVARGTESEFLITGTDYPTRDGSGLRDYIHVWDIARAHLLALENFDNIFSQLGGSFAAMNLGAGQGVTVKELVAAFEKVWGRPINKREAPRRPGDVAGACASCVLAERLLGWRAELSLEQAVADAIKWSEAREAIIKY